MKGMNNGQIKLYVVYLLALFLFRKL